MKLLGSHPPQGLCTCCSHHQEFSCITAFLNTSSSSSALQSLPHAGLRDLRDQTSPPKTSLPQPLSRLIPTLGPVIHLFVFLLTAGLPSAL